MPNAMRGLEAAAQTYERDGAAVLRGVVPPMWIDRMRAAIEELLADPAYGNEFGRTGTSRFAGDMFTYTKHPTVRAFFTETELPALAARVMRSGRVQIFYDQLFVKEPGALVPTPWHQDIPYWPIAGEQVLSIWIPFDDVSPETGVVTYVRGSHRWPELYQPASFAAGRERESGGGSSPALPSLPDIDAEPERYERLAWTLAPGDVLLHHPRTVHGAPGNSSAGTRRRAISIRYAGDDARWLARPGHFLLRPALGALGIPPLRDGDRFPASHFPTVWPR